MRGILLIICLCQLLDRPAYAKPLPFEELLYKGQAIPFYADSTNAEQQKFINLMRNDRMAERMASVVQGALRLRSNLAVGFQSCGEPNAFFDHNKRAIVFCSELFELMVKQAMENKDLFSKMNKERVSAWFNGMVWGFFFHELAHAVIYINQVSITGREEDVADQFAVWFAVHYVDLTKQPIVTPTIWFFKQLAATRQISGSDNESLKRLLSNEHSLDEQRIYNLACWVYGAMPAQGANTARFAGLPQDRAIRCREEWVKLDDGIRQRFAKYIKQPAASGRRQAVN